MLLYYNSNIKEGNMNDLNILFYVFNILFHTSVYIYFVVVPFKSMLRYSFKKTGIIIAVYTILQVSIILLTIETFAPFSEYMAVSSGIALVILAIVTAISCLNCHASQLIFTVLVLWFFQTSVLSISKMLYADNIYIPFLPTNEINYLMISVVILTLFAPFIWFLMIKIFKPIIDININFKFWKYLWTIPAVLYIFFDLYLKYNFKMALDIYPFNDYVSIILWDIVMFTTCCVVLVMLRLTYKGTKLQEQLHSSERLLVIQRNQFENQVKSIDEINRTKHDLRFHILTINEFYQNKQYAELGAYLDKYIKSNTSVHSTTVCANHTANNIINHYINIAKSHDIPTNVSVTIPETLPFPDTDMCIILGNLFENAIEACIAQTDNDKFINLKAVFDDSGTVTLVIKNSYNGIVHCKDNMFISSKRGNSGDEGGVGTASIRHIVKTYNGLLKIEHTDKVFKVSILISK